MNKKKDYFIDPLKQERESLAEERQVFVEKLLMATRKVDELGTKLLQLMEPSVVASNRAIDSNRRFYKMNAVPIR